MKYFVGLVCVSLAYAAMGIFDLLWFILVPSMLVSLFWTLVTCCDGNPVFRSIGEFQRKELMAHLYNAANAEYKHPCD